MRKLSIALALGLVYAIAAPAFAQTEVKNTKETKDVKPAEQTIAGKWKMVVEIESPDNISVLEIKLDGKKVSGQVAAPSGDFPFEGELADGKLTFTLPYHDLKIVFTGSLKDDGTLAGTMDYGNGPFNWKAERVKEK